MVEVKEYIGRLDQGYAEAFLCRGEDDLLYVVKSRRSGTESLVREWVCGRIGRLLGLPIPPIEMMYASTAAATYSGNEDLEALSLAPGFGSLFVGIDGKGPLVNPTTLSVADVPVVDASLQRSILLFDWWTLNFDRTDGNPNLLLLPVSGELRVIDHNLAFGNDSREDFWRYHIFRQGVAMLSDADARATDLLRMNAILLELPTIWSELPDEWTEACSLMFARVDETLRRCMEDGFWNVP